MRHAMREICCNIAREARFSAGPSESHVGTAWAHDLANRRTSAGLANGITTTFEHDLNDRLTMIKHAKDTTTLFDTDYCYDEVGNRLWTRYDATVGLYHFKYRTYNPIWGRWHQQDPLGYVDGVNLYEYVASSPLIFVDIFGLETFREVWNSDEVQKVVKDVWDWAVKNNREVAIEIRVYKNGTRTIAVIPGRRDHVDPDHHWPNDPKGKPGDKKKPGYSRGSGHTHQRDEHEKGPSQQDREWHRKYRQPGVVVWKDKNGKLRQTFVDQDGNDDNDDKDKKGVDEDLKLPPKKGEWKVFDGRKEPDKKNTKC
ncbi:MAG: RHS repeat-associated core domain-containing protein [Phycisphaerae bacterium]|nr:RHS repeat-associated core domain-containing protein [Phycisphaerae bacterium]